MISVALWLFGLAIPCVTHDSSSLMISEALGLFGRRNTCVTCDSSSLMIFEALGHLSWRIHASPVTGVP